MSLKFRSLFQKSLKFRNSTICASPNLDFRCNSKQAGNSHMKVTVVGAAGHVGQPLSLMLKQCPHIDELVLHDINRTCGFGLELGYIDTKPKVIAFSSPDSIGEALKGSKVVVLLAAAPGSSCKSFDDMFQMNAGIVYEFARKFSCHCPTALLAVVTEPVNSMVPLISEAVKHCGNYNPDKIFGVTTINVVRSNAYVGHLLGLEPECVSVIVLGGSRDKTIVPVLSLAKPCADLTGPEMKLLTGNIQRARQEIIDLKKSEESTLAAAFAISRFVCSLIKGILGQPDVIESAFVKCNNPQVKYLAMPLQLGPGGVQRNKGIPELTAYEKCLLDAAILEINKDVQKAETYIAERHPVKQESQSPSCDPCSPDKKTSPCPADECKRRNIKKLNN